MKFRMPLDAQQIVRPGAANGFHDSILRRHRLDPESASQSSYCLVVNGHDTARRFPTLTAVERVKRRTRHEAHRVAIFLIGWRDMRRCGADLRRDVLDKRTTERHIDELRTPANPEHGFAQVCERLEQFDLVSVTQPVRHPARIERALAVEFGTQVRPP